MKVSQTFAIAALTLSLGASAHARGIIPPYMNAQIQGTERVKELMRDSKSRISGVADVYAGNCPEFWAPAVLGMSTPAVVPAQRPGVVISFALLSDLKSFAKATLITSEMMSVDIEGRNGYETVQIPVCGVEDPQT